MMYRVNQQTPWHLRIIQRRGNPWFSALLLAAYTAGIAMGILGMVVVGGRIFDNEGQKDRAALQASSTDEKVNAIPDSCGVKGTMHEGLAQSPVSQLRKLAEYEQVCRAPVAERMSFFVGTPDIIGTAREEAGDVAGMLREFAKYDTKPIVFMEPATDGRILDYQTFRAGGYDEALDAYFSSLKAAGITDAMMGMWVPFPEGNTPAWGNVDPSSFAANVTKVVQIQKKYFPGSQASVLLDSKTYPSGTSWDEGAYKGLEPYVRPIPAGLVDAFGLQGFPWPPMEKNDPGVTDPRVFLRADMAVNAAKAMGVQEVWFNTGTYGKSLKLGDNHPYVRTPQQRQAVLKGIAEQAKVAHKAGMRTSVHIFAEDKSKAEEAIDWSYWPDGQAGTDGAGGTFKAFAAELAADDIPLWLYDASQQQ